MLEKKKQQVGFPWAVLIRNVNLPIKKTPELKSGHIEKYYNDFIHA